MAKSKRSFAVFPANAPGIKTPAPFSWLTLDRRWQAFQPVIMNGKCRLTMTSEAPETLRRRGRTVEEARECQKRANKLWLETRRDGFELRFENFALQVVPKRKKEVRDA